MCTIELKDTNGRLVRIDIDVDTTKDSFQDFIISNWEGIINQASGIDLITIENAVNNRPKHEERADIFVLLVLGALKGGEQLIDDFVNWKWHLNDIVDEKLKVELLDIIESGLKRKEDGYSLGVFYDIFDNRCTPLMRMGFLRESDQYDEDVDKVLEETLNERVIKLEKEIQELKKKQKQLLLFRNAMTNDGALMDLMPLFEEEGDEDNAIQCLCKSASNGNEASIEELAQRLYREKSYFGARYWFAKNKSKSKEYAIIRYFGLDGFEPEKTEAYFERVFPLLEAERFYEEKEYDKTFSILNSIPELEEDPSGKYLYRYAELFFRHQDRIESGDPDKAFRFLKLAIDKGYELAVKLRDIIVLK